jgi:ADP-ribose pyrophosphatase
MAVNLKPWTVVDHVPVFSAGPIKEIARETVALPDGRVVPDYYTATFGDYALVYAVTREGKVLLLRQYKHGCRRVCLTFPGGHVGAGEEAAAAVERELLEETGYRIGSLRPLGSFVTNANQGCNKAHLFRADGCWFEQPPRSGDLEEMELVQMAPAELVQAIPEMAVLGYVALALLGATPLPGS